MDEAVAGHANRIDFILESATTLTIRDNGRGMPTGKHPKFPEKSAVEVIMTTRMLAANFLVNLMPLQAACMALALPSLMHYQASDGRNCS